MALNSLTNVGIRRECGTLGMRNFEDSGTVEYKALREPTIFLGTSYNSGDTLPFDVGGTSYSLDALAELQQLWNDGNILPLA